LLRRRGETDNSSVTLLNDTLLLTPLAMMMMIIIIIIMNAHKACLNDIEITENRECCLMCPRYLWRKATRFQLVYSLVVKITQYIFFVAHFDSEIKVINCMLKKLFDILNLMRDFT
jgi:hypothetical protein